MDTILTILKKDFCSEVIGNGMASNVIFSNVILIETEQEQGAAIKYVLALE